MRQIQTIQVSPRLHGSTRIHEDIKLAYQDYLQSRLLLYSQSNSTNIAKTRFFTLAQPHTNFGRALFTQQHEDYCLMVAEFNRTKSRTRVFSVDRPFWYQRQKQQGNVLKYLVILASSLLYGCI